MRVLLCLPSEQHLPNLLAVHQFLPDRLVVLGSPGGRRAEAPGRLLDVLREGGLDYAGRHEVEPLADEYRLAEVTRALAAAHGRHPGDEWVVNLTGGTKVTAIAAYEFFRARGATLVYSNAARPEVVQFLADGREEPWRHRPSVREFLTGYGFREPGRPRAAGREAAAPSPREAALALAARAGPADLLLVDEGQWQAARQGRLVLRPEWCGPVLREPAVRGVLARSLGLAEEAGGLAGKLSRQAGGFLTGGWLEAFFCGLLDRHREALGCWDVRAGLQVVSAGGVRNELDVAFLRRYELNVIECKTGSQGENPAEDVLYKVEAVAQQLRAKRARKFLATTADNVLDGATGRVREALRTRAALYNCTIVPAARIRELAARHDSAGAVAEVLGL